MSSALFLAIVIPIAVLILAAGWYLTFWVELWVLSFFVDNPKTRYLCVGLFSLVLGGMSKPLSLIIGLPVLALMAWRDPAINPRS